MNKTLPALPGKAGALPGSGHHAVLDEPAEDSALRPGAERRAGAVPGPGGEAFLPAAR